MLMHHITSRPSCFSDDICRFRHSGGGSKDFIYSFLGPTDQGISNLIWYQIEFMIIVWMRTQMLWNLPAIPSFHHSAHWIIIWAGAPSQTQLQMNKLVEAGWYVHTDYCSSKIKTIWWIQWIFKHGGLLKRDSISVKKFLKYCVGDIAGDWKVNSSIFGHFFLADVATLQVYIHYNL